MVSSTSHLVRHRRRAHTNEEGPAYRGGGGGGTAGYELYERTTFSQHCLTPEKCLVFFNLKTLVSYQICMLPIAAGWEPIICRSWTASRRPSEYPSAREPSCRAKFSTWVSKVCHAKSRMYGTYMYTVCTYFPH